ncbi:MAG: cation-translocating P-type ATPase family protein, partial [Armatimonadota bacterium]
MSSTLRDWLRFLWHHALTPLVVAVLLVLYWQGVWRSVFGVDLAAILTLVGGWRIFYEAISKLLRLRLSADLAVALAAIAALIIGENVAAAEVILIMLIGEGLEEFAVARTRGALRALAAAQPTLARLREDGTEREVPVEQVEPGQVVVVRPGERLPLDGEVIEGSSAVDQSPITGESMPATKRPGDPVYAGTLNGVGRLEIRVTAAAEDTTLATIVRLAEEAEEKKAPIERRADRYATYFVPAVLAAAGLTYLVTRQPIQAIAVMIIACPCALVLATPAAVASAIGRLALDGILVKSGAALESVGTADCVVLDKTGTLTEGRPRLARIVPTAEVAEDEVLRLAALAEGHSEHVLGALIRDEAARRGLSVGQVEQFEALPGVGVVATAAEGRVLVGSEALLADQGVQVGPEVLERKRGLEEEGLTVVVVGTERGVLGLLAAEDPVRDGAKRLGERLRELDVERIVVLSGDAQVPAERVAEQVGLAEVAAELLPQEKVSRIEQLQGEGATVVMVGDGINDAPSLAAADVGVAMGGIGTDVAAEAADAVLIADDLDRLPELIGLSRRAHRTIRENLIYFALIFNGAAVIAAAVGLVRPVSAAVIHQISSLLVVGNSLLLLGAGRAAQTRPGRAWRRVVQAFAGARARLAEADWLGGLRRGWEQRARIGRWVALGLAVLYVWWGVFLVRPEQVGVVRLFGRMVADTVPPGLHYWPPPPFGSVKIVPQRRVRAAEIGFRSAAAGAPPAPAAYEWSFQHRAGGYRKVPEESILLTGDANMVSVTMVVQYLIADAGDYLWVTAEPDRLVQAAAQAALREAVTATSLDDVLTARRREIEQAVAAGTQQRVVAYGCGLTVLRVALQDVHPPVEAVAAFRDVASAREE